MSEGTLAELAGEDVAGRPLFRLAAVGDDLVLRGPSAAQEVGELDLGQRIRLAAASQERPALVVEGEGGDYVVLVDDVIDLDRYVPLGPADAEFLTRSAARARFGRRDDDLLTLTPWAEEDDVVVVDLDSADLADLPVVERVEDGSLTWHRGRLQGALAAAVADELDRSGAEPGVRFGVLTNTFGECRCVEDGALLPPHEDVRQQTLLGTSALLDGAATLDEAAERLRAMADRLAGAEEAGWRLVQPVVDGLAFLERSPLRAGQGWQGASGAR